jgi:hypothetical protein
MRWRSRPDDEFLIAALAEHVGGVGARLERLETGPLTGGAVSPSVERLELTVVAASGARMPASFVRKACAAREVQALSAIAGVRGAAAAPELVAAWTSDNAPADEGASGLVIPYYPGPALHFGDPIPAGVLTTLARIHAGAAPADSWARPVDAGRIDALRAFAQRTLAASEQFKALADDWPHWAQRLEAAAAAPALREAAESLPRTLTHGDMHPGNIVTRADGSPVIIDWGNACLAPPMLDLANIIEPGSADWRIYLTAFESAGGRLDAAVATRAFWWARAVTALMYVPWAADHSDRVPALIAQMEDATARLASL